MFSDMSGESQRPAWAQEIKKNIQKLNASLKPDTLGRLEDSALFSLAIIINILLILTYYYMLLSSS